jgi:hypothetical protein
MRRLIFLLGAIPAFAGGLFDFGVKGGIPLNDAISAAGNFHSDFAHWTLGPTADLNLPFGLGVEFDMLLKRTGYSNGSAHNATSFEFPLLAKYKFPGKMARVYVSGGLSFRAITDIPLLTESTSKGFVFGAGMRYDFKLVKISPELRYTRWDNKPFEWPGLQSVQNQTEFLIGITF